MKISIMTIVTTLVIATAPHTAHAKGKGGNTSASTGGGGIEIPPLGGGEVKMPWVEFAKLLDALESEDEKQIPPTQYAIEKALYQCEVNAEAEKATIKATFEVKVLAEDWTTVNLVSGPVAMNDFKVSGADDVSLVQSWGQVNALVKGPAEFAVALTMSSTIDAAHGMKNLAIQGPQSVSGSLECTIEGKDLEIKVEPGIVDELVEKDGKTLVRANLVSGGAFNLKWWEEVNIPESEKKELPVKIYGEVHTLLRIGEGLVRGVTGVDYSILQSGLNELTILVPEEISVTDVKGADLASWEIRDEDGGKVLHAFLAYKVKNSTSLSISWDHSMGKTSAVVAVPRIRLLNVERETGTFGVEVLTNVEVSLETLEGMAQIDSTELAHPVMWAAEHPLLLGFKYLKHPYSLVLDVKKHEDVPILVATVDVADVTTLLTKDGKILTKALLSMRNNMKQFLKVELPPDSEVWSTHVADKPVKPGKDDQGRILVPLEKSNTGGGSMQSFPVEIVYLTQADKLGNKGMGHVELCQFDLPVTHLQWRMYLPDKYKFKSFEGNVDEWEGAFEPIPTAAPAGAYDIIEQQQASYQMNVFEGDNIDGLLNEYIAPVQSMSKGVLPVKLSVPEKGKLKQFMKLLVIDEAAEISFKYKLPYKYR